MWIWLYGLSVTLYFWFLSLELSTFLLYLPLFVIGTLNVGAAVQKLVTKEDASVLLAMLASNILFTTLVYIEPKDMYYIFSIVFGIIVLLTVSYHASSIFISPPKWLALLNMTSLVLSVIIYVLLYGTIKTHVDDYVVLLPLGILLVLEAYATYTIYNGLDTIKKERSQEMAQNRLTYTTALLILLITTIIQTYDIISMNINFGIATIVYALLIIIRTATYLARLCRTQTQVNYRSLKEESINESPDV